MPRYYVVDVAQQEPDLLVFKSEMLDLSNPYQYAGCVDKQRRSLNHVWLRGCKEGLLSMYT